MGQVAAQLKIASIVMMITASTNRGRRIEVGASAEFRDE